MSTHNFFHLLESFVEMRLTLCICLFLATLDQLERTMLLKNLLRLGLNCGKERPVAKATNVYIGGVV